MSKLKKAIPHGQAIPTAERLGITRQYLSLLMTGRRRPSPELAARIEDELGGTVTFRELLLPEEESDG